MLAKLTCFKIFNGRTDDSCTPHRTPQTLNLHKTLGRSGFTGFTVERRLTLCHFHIQYFQAIVSIWSPSVSEIRNQQAKRRVGQNAYRMTTVDASRFLCLPGFPESLVPFKFAADSKLRLLETTLNPKP